MLRLNNKMKIMSKSALFLLCALSLTVYVTGVNGGDILSLKRKYFDPVGLLRYARSLRPDQEGQHWSQQVGPRHRRSYAAKAQVSSDFRIAINKFILKHTESENSVDLHWVGENSTEQRVFILTVKYSLSHGQVDVEESALWCSDDQGETFNMRNFSQNTKISSMYTFPSNPRKLIFTDSHNKLIYTTDDGLLHNSSHSVPVEPERIVPHPSDENRLLLYSYTQQKLYSSEDFAASWTLVSERVLPEFYWGDVDFDPSDNVVHLQIEAEMPSQALYKVCLLPGCQPVGGNLDEVGPFMSGTLRVHKEFIFVQKENHNGSQSYLMVSHKRGRFRRAQFPSSDKTRNFLILDLGDGQVFVAVHHGNVVNLYLSDTTGQNYVLSLADVLYEEKLDWFDIEFTEVKGMNWTFMANKREKSSSSVPGFTRTYVSYDKGGNWAPLFINKTCVKEEDCALLLEVKNSYEVAPVTSIESAPGLILAHGLLGQNQNDRQMSVFVTNDGGATWKQAPFDTTCHLSVLGHGSVLTAIPTGLDSKIVHYSLDQGNSWKSQTFDEIGLWIHWIVTEPGDNALVQSLFGQHHPNKPWVYVKLDMKSLFTRKCNESDYEPWSPQDYNTDDSTKGCVLGRVIQYSRRKPEVICHIDRETAPHIVNNSVCVCTVEDYECDFGFERTGDKCLKAGWFDESYVVSECDDGGDYLKSQGYRKIPADACIENEADQSKYDRKKASCPSAAPSGLSLMTQMKVIPLGKSTVFFLDQARGSKWDTTFTWNFGDHSKSLEDTGFKKASQKQHTFQTSGNFNITVTAKNQKGEAKVVTTVHVQDRLTKLQLIAPWAAVTNVPIKIYAMPMSSVQWFPSTMDDIHYLWSFGDEAPGNNPRLSWNASGMHTYTRAGTYTIKIEASNSISSISEEIPIRIFGSAVILEIRFNDTSGWHELRSPVIVSLFTHSLRQQICQDLGLNRDRLVAMVMDNQPVAHLYLFTTERDNELTVDEIKDTIIDQTKKGLLGFDLFGSHFNSKGLIKIVSAKEITGSPDKHQKSGPNLVPVFVAVPVLAGVLICCVVAIVFYYHRKRNPVGRHYNIFHAQDDSDTMLDDEDVAPLNMNLEFSQAQDTRDDLLIDSGGDCLVMETGGTVADNMEIY